MLLYIMCDTIEGDNLFHLNRFKHIPPNPSYIAGFIDGDGCIFIRKIVQGYQSGISFTQCRTNILQTIRYHFGGSITSSSKRNDKTTNLMDKHNEYYHKYNVRNQYNLLIRHNEYQVLIDYLQNSFIIKENQYQCLCEFNKLTNLQHKCEEKELLHIQCANLNKTCEINDAYLSRLNIEYIAGLFDAEGCIYINSKFNVRITIAQKNHPSLLHEIVNFLGFGKVCDICKYTLYKHEHCLKLIRLMLPHLIVKYNQANAFIIMLTTTDATIKQSMYQICNREKHEIELFTELNKQSNGKEGYQETMRLKSIKTQICKEINTKQFYKDKSEKMSGETNHNYGKTFSEETKKKMSTSIRDSKGGISDEDIIKVRQLLKEGYKNIDIQQLMNLPRHTVTRIKNGMLICRNEERQAKVSSTQELVNLSKRKINAEDIITTIEKHIEKWKPTQILDYFIEQNKNNITIDIIKNIKRNLQNSKPIIYESELTTDRYEHYLYLLTIYKQTII
jgi:hypothetical protein